jgi:hypothetical protein
MAAATGRRTRKAMVVAGQVATKFRQSTPKERRRGASGFVTA